MIFKGVSYSYVTIIISIIVGLLSVPLLLDSLGAELFGVWILAQSISGYINQFSFGVPSATGVLMAKSLSRVESSDVLKKTTILLLTIVTVVALVFVFLYLFLADDKDIFLNISKENIDNSLLAIIIIGSFTLVQIPLNNASQAFIGMGHIHIERIYYAIALVMGLISLYWSAYKEYGIVDTSLIFMILTTIVKILSSTHALIKYKKPKVFKPDFKTQSYREIISSSKAFFYIGACATFVYNIDVIAIGYFLDIKFVTQYSLVFKIISYMILLVGTINSVIAPKYGHLLSLGKWKEVQRLYSRSLLIVPMISSALMMFCVLFIKDIQYYWLGSTDNYAGIFVVGVFACYIYIGSFINTYATLINSLNMAKKAINITLLEGVSNLIITVILIKEYGIVGAAIGTLVAASFTSMLLLPSAIKKITYGKIVGGDIIVFHGKLFLYLIFPFFIIFLLISNNTDLIVRALLFSVYVLSLILILFKSKIYKSLSFNKVFAWV